MSSRFQTEHLRRFKALYPSVPVQGPVGHSVLPYLERVMALGHVVKLREKLGPLDRKIDRIELRQLCTNGSDRLFCFCAIMAWGMRKSYFRKWKDFDAALKDGHLVSKLQAIEKAPSRREAFELLTGTNRIPGLGIAFFTKLIFFFRRDGYILDQWTAKSADLMARELELPVKGYGPSALATGQHYENFCLLVEELASEMGGPWTPSDVEVAMFGGRRDKSAWRQYVIQNWR